MTEIYLILGAFLLSVLCGGIFIPLIANFCKKKGLYDQPDSRKVHKRNIPRLGGICFMPSMLLSSFIVIWVFNHNDHAQTITVSTWSIMFFYSLLLIYGVGLVDDLIGLGAKTKFAVQTLAAFILPFSGLYINNLYGLLGIHEISYAVGCLLTIFLIIFICNAINLIDGIDGLSAGLSFIALAGFLVCFIQAGIYSYCILIAGLMGVLVSFLYFNIWGDVSKSRKIFMGDSGSLTLGYILGFLFVKLTMVNPGVKSFGADSLVVAYSLLLVPTFDVVRVAFVRMMHRTPIFKADKNHIHHKLMRAGYSQHQALCIILSTAVGFIALNLLLNRVADITWIVAADCLLWLAIQLFINRKIRACGKPVYLSADSREH